MSFESKLLSNLSSNPPFWLRYVDDIIFLGSNEDLFEDFRAEVNSLLPSIRFTLELEQGKRIPFLDTMTKDLHQDSLSQSTASMQPTRDSVSVTSRVTRKRLSEVFSSPCFYAHTEFE